MKKSKVFLFIGILMVVAAFIFFIFALNHPEMSFIWPNVITYIIYVVYLVVTVTMFLLARKK